VIFCCDVNEGVRVNECAANALQPLLVIEAGRGDLFLLSRPELQCISTKKAVFHLTLWIRMKVLLLGRITPFRFLVLSGHI